MTSTSDFTLLDPTTESEDAVATVVKGVVYAATLHEGEVDAAVAKLDEILKAGENAPEMTDRQRHYNSVLGAMIHALRNRRPTARPAPSGATS